ncbi:acyl-CoA dehydrogenase family protein [Novosphingobium sp.]|uniref:acyl-CoA dehydrogenase family protein n=1 Tax=Novosphingobium sp. TaxID=1874826 RepID=UPI003D0B5C1C
MTPPYHHAADGFAQDSVPDPVENARALRPWLADRAAQTEREGRISADATSRLIAGGLTKVGQPARFGGQGGTPGEIFRIGFELGQACPSTAWCMMIANGLAWLIAYWPIAAQRDVWGDNPDAVVGGTFVPTGKCEATDGGFLVSGAWPFASNCDNTDWFFVAAMLPDVDGAPAGPGWFLVPRADLTIDADSWSVAGMQGTGSKTLIARDPVFVPAHRALRFMDVVRGTTPGRVLPDNVQAGFNFATIGGVVLVAPLLGAAQAALDWFATAMRTKVKTSLRPGAPASVADGPDAQLCAGQAQARIEAALALLTSKIAAFEAKVLAGEDPSPDDRIGMRRAIAFAAQQARDVVGDVFAAAGASGAAQGQPIQRLWRDVTVGANHASLDIPAIYRMSGQHLFGLVPMGAH